MDIGYVLKAIIHSFICHILQSYGILTFELEGFINLMKKKALNLLRNSNPKTSWFVARILPICAIASSENIFCETLIIKIKQNVTEINHFQSKWEDSKQLLQQKIRTDDI